RNLDQTNERPADRGGEGAVPVEDDPARGGNVGMGRCSCSSGGDRRAILRELPCRENRAGRRDHQWRQRRRTRICTRSKNGRGALEKERRTRRRVVLAVTMLNARKIEQTDQQKGQTQ